MFNFAIGLFVGAVIGFFVAALFCGRKCEDEQYEAAMKRWEEGMGRAEKWLEKQEAKPDPGQDTLT